MDDGTNRWTSSLAAECCYTGALGDECASGLQHVSQDTRHDGHLKIILLVI